MKIFILLQISSSGFNNSLFPPENILLKMASFYFIFLLIVFHIGQAPRALHSTYRDLWGLRVKLASNGCSVSIWGALQIDCSFFSCNPLKLRHWSQQVNGHLTACLLLVLSLNAGNDLQCSRKGLAWRARNNVFSVLFWWKNIPISLRVIHSWTMLDWHKWLKQNFKK